MTAAQPALETLLKDANVNSADVAALAKGIETLQKSLPAGSRALLDNGLKEGSQERLEALFGDPARRAELDKYLSERAGVAMAGRPRENVQSIMTVIVTVCAHC